MRKSELRQIIREELHISFTGAKEHSISECIICRAKELQKTWNIHSTKFRQFIQAVNSEPIDRKKSEIIIKFGYKELGLAGHELRKFVNQATKILRGK
jgi:hypothetical protein